MNTFRILVVLCVVSALADLAAADDAAQRPPFTLAVVPSGSSPEARTIALADERPDIFYVILTNQSEQPQPVWLTQFSWGHWTISFDLATSDGKHLSVSMDPNVWFTRNLPGTFMVPPGGHQVYPIRLDKGWINRPKFPEPGEAPITLKAIYEVHETPESKRLHVWTGRVESNSYQFTLRHW